MEEQQVLHIGNEIVSTNFTNQNQNQKEKSDTHTQSDPIEIIITTIHLRALLIFLGFNASSSSHPTMKLSPACSSSDDILSALPSSPARLVPSFKDQDRSKDRDGVAWALELGFVVELLAPLSRGKGCVIGAKPASSDFESTLCSCSGLDSGLGSGSNSELEDSRFSSAGCGDVISLLCFPF